MALFLATHTNRVDAKGRVSVPAPFRAAIGQSSFQGIVVFQSHTSPALEGFSWDQLEKMSAALDSYDMFSQAHDDLAMTMFGNAVPLSFDSTGRVMLPPELREFAGIGESAAFVGQGRKFQIWSPEALEAHKPQARGRVREQGLTLNLQGPGLQAPGLQGPGAAAPPRPAAFGGTPGDGPGTAPPDEMPGEIPGEMPGETREEG